VSDPQLLDREGLDALIVALAADGRLVVGPTRRGPVVDLDEISSVDDLPGGWSDHQVPGRYALEPTDDGSLFAYTTTATSPRRYLHPSHETLVRIRRSEGGFTVEEPEPGPAPALVGVRACDVAAIDVADRVARAGSDDVAVQRRADAVVVAAACTRAGPTCFCVSMGTGPDVPVGHDLVLTELLDGGGHRFLVEVGTPQGADLLERVPTRPAAAADVAAAAAAVDRARDQERSIELEGLHDALLGSLEHDRWGDVADRCLSCGSCTLVCPTCFCTTIEDRTQLSGRDAERNRRWESCFSLDHSHLGSGSVRGTVEHRYRQWLTHKLATWVDQFDEVGCVGCGRCLTWCPVAIDLTEEVAALREPPMVGASVR
jgi:ferredoxin